jgi:hypothetical protein
MSEYPVGHATRYPTIGGIPVSVHMGGKSAYNLLTDQTVTIGDDRPEIHVNAFAVAELGDLIVWKDYKENHE